MSGTRLTVACGNHHLTSSVIHVASHIIYIRTLDALRTAYHNVIGRVHTVAAGAVSTKQIVPAIIVDEVGSLTVDSDILLLVAALAEAGCRIELNQADGAEICAVAHPQTSCGGIKHDTRVDGILIFQAIGETYLDSLRPFEVG